MLSLKLDRTSHMGRRYNEILGLVLIALSIWTMYDLIVYVKGGFLAGRAISGGEVWFAGLWGHQVAETFFALVGFASFAVPFLFFSWGLNRLRGNRFRDLSTKTISIVITVFLFCAVSGLLRYGHPDSLYRLGGLLGMNISPRVLIPYLGKIGSWLLVITLLLSVIILSTDISFLELLNLALGRRPKRKAEAKVALPEAKIRKKRIPTPSMIEFPKPEIVEPGIGKDEINPPEEAQISPERAEMFYQPPPITLLEVPPQRIDRQSREELLENARRLESSLATFQVEGRVVQVNPGPVITRYELEPAPGVKVNRILALADDLALTMKASRIRILAPIPGKAAVGIEIPNPRPSVVYLREIIESGEFQRSSSKLTLALGKTTSGEPYCTDLVRMPHLLIAGATGSGKSVCLNAMVTSILFKATPQEARFIMIDPKMLELSVYNDIPHLLTPVLTEARRATEALRWAVREMEGRYKSLSVLGVRNIDEYNLKVGQEGHRPDIDQPLSLLPYIVIVIDELADLMLLANEIEESLVRLAQMARAVGIHLVLATQRPSVDVITGLIKANFPTRIAFQVASKIDSRTILDMSGAEKLLGNGDMLFLPSGRSEPIRIHGAYISRTETERLVDFLKEQGIEPERKEVLEKEIKLGEEEKDELFDEAARLVIRHQQGSISLLQRRLKIGYARAARLIDQLEAAGIVGPFDGARARAVLVDESYLKKDM